MANPLFGMLGGNNASGNMTNLMRQFQQFKNTFQGNPQQQVQQLLNSGRISQDQYNAAVQQAKALQKMLGSM